MNPGSSALVFLLIACGLFGSVATASEAKDEFNIISGPAVFIEAEDFNFSDAEGVNPGQHADFGAPDGSLRDKAATIGIDVNDDAGIGDAICCNPYRPSAHVEGAKGGPGGGVDVAERGDRLVEQNWVVGWTAAGDWANYTRAFPNAAYRVYVRASALTETVAELGEVTSDPTQPNQTVRRIGTFVVPAAAAPENFTYAPLRDATGQQVVVRLNGMKTLRYTVVSGDHDYNFLAFVAEPCIGPGPPDFISPAPSETVEGTQPLVWGRFFNSCYTTRSVIGVSINDVDVTAGSQIISGVDGTEFLYQVPAPGFPPNSTVNVAVSLLHISGGVRTTNVLRWTFHVGPITPDTLFIEAEDFNFSDADGVNPGQHINFGAPDGSLLNREGTVGIDYYDSEHNDADPRSSIYRPDTGVEAAKGGLGGGTDSANRGIRDITVNWVVGWMTSGEWMNYTREFPSPARRYHVYARVSSVCPEKAQLDFVTSDPSQPDQTTRKLGVFDSPSSGGWEVFHIIPLKTDLGAVAAVRLGGKQTIRFTPTTDCMEINWLAFVPAPPGRSQIASVGPGLNREWPNPYSPLVYATISHGDTPVLLSTVKLTVDGVVRTTDATITETDSDVAIALQLPGDEGALHTALVEWDDGQGVQSHAWTFREGPRYSVDHLFIEAEDFNTGAGDYFPSNPELGHGFNDKGLYLGTSAVPEVDFHDSGNLEENNYRHDDLNIGMIPLDDANRNGSGERPGFEIASDYKIGWTDAAGDWYNYTRTFPPGNYRVWARLAYGDAAATMGGQLDLVTSDPTASNQTLVTLGEFMAPASGDWEAFQFVPLIAGGGEPVWVRLGGEQTLRYTVKRAGGDINYLMFVPQIRCPQDIQANADAGQCSATVNFAVVSGTSCTPPSGAAFPVGVTEVFCVGDGQECSFAITIEDREPPTIVVRAGANPAGKIKAKSADDGGSFHEILAGDNCGTAPLIFIKDATSNFVAGPYHSGVRLKLVPNSGSNQINKGPNGLAEHINIVGAAHIYATDPFGNVSQPVSVSK